MPCKLKSVVARFPTHLKHCHATKFRCCKLKQHVAKCWTDVYFLQQIYSTCNNKFCYVTMFEVGGNNVVLQVEEKCCPYYLALTIELVNIECGLLSRVSQKSVSTKWRIYKGNWTRPKTFCWKSKTCFFFKWQGRMFFTKKRTG